MHSIHNGASFLQIPGFIFCTLVHRSALDFEPGTKRHNIWYPVQELLEMLPYGWAKPSQTHIWTKGLDRKGKMAEKYISPYFLLEWKWKWGFKVLFFNPPNTRKHLKIFLGLFESSIFETPAKTPLITAKPEEDQSSPTSLIAERF